jgi:azurin
VNSVFILTCRVDRVDDARRHGGAGGEAAKAAPQVRTVKINRDGRNEIHAERDRGEAGRHLRVTLTVVSQMPKIAMGHNFVLVHKAADIDPLVNAAMLARATDYFPPAWKTKVIAVSALNRRGRERDGRVHRAATRGSYPYLCTFPGHYAAGAKGMLTVK